MLAGIRASSQPTQTERMRYAWQRVDTAVMPKMQSKLDNKYPAYHCLA